MLYSLYQSICKRQKKNRNRNADEIKRIKTKQQDENV